MQSELPVLRRALTWSSTVGVILTLPLGDQDGPSCAWGNLLPGRGRRAHRVLINAGDHGSPQRRWRFALVGWRVGAGERTEVVTLETDDWRPTTAPGRMQDWLLSADEVNSRGGQACNIPITGGPGEPRFRAIKA